MILIVGGEGSGKRTFVESFGYMDSDIADATLDERPVLVHLEQLVAQLVMQGGTINPSEDDELIAKLCEKEVVVCNEVGSDIVPIDPVQVHVREETGRLCILLAQQAEVVVRMTCGIPQAIKGSLK